MSSLSCLVCFQRSGVVSSALVRKEVGHSIAKYPWMNTLSRMIPTSFNLSFVEKRHVTLFTKMPKRKNDNDDNKFSGYWDINRCRDRVK